MKFSILKYLTVLAMAGFLNSATAATLTIEFPGNSLNYSTSTGSSLDAQIYVDGLPDFGSFDFNIIYDSNKLSALSLDSASIFGAGSDTAYGLQSLGNYVPYTISTSGGVGDVHFAEAISGTSALTAGLNITGPTLLGTLHFTALATAANSLVNITSPILSDFAGTQLSGTVQAAYVTITPAAVVPLPAAVWLFAPFLLAVFAMKKQTSNSVG
jgi:hypothetical protein